MAGNAIHVGVDALVAGAAVEHIEGTGAFSRQGANQAIINVRPGPDWVDLTVTGTLQDGSRRQWIVKLNQQTGQVEAQLSDGEQGQALPDEVQDATQQALNIIHFKQQVNASFLSALSG